MAYVNDTVPLLENSKCATSLLPFFEATKLVGSEELRFGVCEYLQGGATFLKERHLLDSEPDFFVSRFGAWEETMYSRITSLNMFFFRRTRFSFCREQLSWKLDFFKIASSYSLVKGVSDMVDVPARTNR